MKKVHVFIILVCIGIMIFLLSKIKSSLQPTSGKFQITTSFYPLSYLVERIGGEYVTVVTLTPAGVEPHEFEPNARSLAELSNQQLILLNGGGMEGYGEKLTDKSLNLKGKVIRVGEKLMNRANDPHVWLDPVLYAKEAKIVEEALIVLDPAHTQYYQEQYNKLSAELHTLDAEFKANLGNCKSNTIITAHNAFGYLTARYGISQKTLSGISPDEEPSAKTLGEITDYAKQHKVRYIFFEELVSPTLSNTLAHEVNAQTLVLNPLEGLTIKDVQARKSYLSIQKENLKNLQIALECGNEQ